MEPEPVPDEAALIIGKSLLVADLHIGVEEEFRQKGYNIPSLTHHLEKRIVKMLDGNDVDKLIILGDLKHGIVGTRQDYREVKSFLWKMLDCIEIDIVKGNHDGNIGNWTRSMDGVTVHGARGFRMEEYGLLHGHALPSEDIWMSDVLIVGHEHPVVRFVDRMGIHVYMKTWMRIGFKDAETGPKEMIVVPAFNDYLGGTSVNAPDATFLGPLLKRKDLNLEDARLFLLDGTFLGKRKDLI
jgi:putative SbcD/Mre11-related phosphoesterase